MNLLFQPEPTALLRQRFERALRPVYTTTEIARGAVKAADQRQHVFDFEDGTRAVISHEKLGERLYLHCTFSMDRRCQIMIRNFPGVCVVKAKELAGLNLTLTQSDSTNTCLHLLFEPIIEDDGSRANVSEDAH